MKMELYGRPPVRIYLGLKGAPDLVAYEEEFKGIYDIGRTERDKENYHHACVFFPTEFLTRETAPCPTSFDEYYDHYYNLKLSQTNLKLTSEWFNGCALVTESVIQIKALSRFFHSIQQPHYILNDDMVWNWVPEQMSVKWEEGLMVSELSDLIDQTFLADDEVNDNYNSGIVVEKEILIIDGVASEQQSLFG